MPFQNLLGESSGYQDPSRCNDKMSMQQTYAYPENAVKSKKPRVYTRAEWGAQRERIKLHYFDEGRCLADVKGIMSSRYDFHATEKQYKTRIKAWGLEKKVKTEEMKAIIRIREKRKSEGRRSVFLVRGRIVPDQKIERFKKSHKEPICPESPSATPSDIECFTPGPDDSYSPLGSSPDNVDWSTEPWEPVEETPKCSYTRSNTPLHEAARSGNSSEVQHLLDSGHSYNRENLFGQTPLHIAAANGHHCVVQILLEAGTSVDALDDHSWTPLQCGSRNGHSSVVRKLLEWGADVVQTDDFHRTPLHWAAANGHERIVRILISKERANLDWHDGGGSGLTPLQLAANGSHAAAVYELLLAGANTNLVDSWGLKRTALHLAAKTGNEVIIQLLLDFHAGPCQRDSLERTSLHWAAKNGHEAVVEKLLGTGRFDESLNSPDVCWTPLHWAAMNGHEEVAKRLIFAGAGLDVERDWIVRSGVTPSHLAAGGHRGWQRD
ncbi:unnamed protein product [Tuber aestivum]|uniref:Clr5 domain-containing protein n=1 Tax=Tuber aestivum TaxID=59557 RepID=A0A292Q8C6_9PEZI|nr:unnamed protein product [Tuber aestivum]